MYTTKSPGCPFDVLTIGSSAGGIHALTELLYRLPTSLPVTILIVQHCSADWPNILPEVLGRRSALFIKHAEEGENLIPGRVYTAPPGRHLLVGATRTAILSDGPKVCHCRPSADILFKSPAAQFHQRTLAVVLTGSNHDGADGVRCIRSVGGLVIAQDAGSSLHFDMPRAAIDTACVDFILPLERIGCRDCPDDGAWHGRMDANSLHGAQERSEVEASISVS
jgi:two-component system, chemotaxis family, protein-glutamate methylesterase/glutaminase